MKTKRHPALGRLKRDMRQGTLSRREFMRYAALLGAAVAPGVRLGGFAAQPALAAVYGASLNVSGRLEPVDHPAALSWVAPSQPLRQVLEYLTCIDADNVTRPFLLEAWDANAALDTWTLRLKKGIYFNNGDELCADDVVFSMQQWLDPDGKSSLKSTMGRYLNPNDIEKTGRYQITLYLRRPQIALPEHLAHYAAVILNHRTFEGDFLAAPHGTGPFTIESFESHTQCRLIKRRGYWQPGLPFLDSITFFDLWQEPPTRVDALLNAKIDLIDTSDIDALPVYEQLKGKRDIRLLPVLTGGTNVIRMRVDKAPWSDNRIRQAIKLCQHREKLLLMAYAGQGMPGHDCHVGPAHPAFCPSDAPPRFDPRKAQALLAEAGYSEGLDVELTIGDGRDDVRRLAELLKKDAQRAGFRIQLITVPEERYRRTLWKQVDFGITPWPHRSPATATLNLAYAVDENGKPGPWNETRWVDDEFCEVLDAADQTLNIPERRRLMCRLQEIQTTRGPVGIAWWKNNWLIGRRTLGGIPPSPFGYLNLHTAWKIPS